MSNRPSISVYRLSVNIWKLYIQRGPERFLIILFIVTDDCNWTMKFVILYFIFILYFLYVAVDW